MKNITKIPVIGVLSHADNGNEDDIFPGRALHYIDRIYSDILVRFGMLPIIIPVNSNDDFVDSTLNVIDGIYGTGGGKISKRILERSEIPNLKETAPERYGFETKLFKKAIDKDLPILGVCRSMQTLNEIYDGTICKKISTEIDDSIEHNQTYKGILLNEPYHNINIDKESLLFRILEKEHIKVNSWHSQSVLEP